MINSNSKIITLGRQKISLTKKQLNYYIAKFNLNPNDEDGDDFTISLVEGYPEYVNFNSTDNSIIINAPLGSPNNEICFNVTDDL